MNLHIRFCSACSEVFGVFFTSQKIIWASDKVPFPPPSQVTVNSALHTVCPERLPERTLMGGNIMLIAHTPRFIVVKNPLASKKTFFPSHLNSTHTGRALQHAHSAGKLLFLSPQTPQRRTGFRLAGHPSACRKHPEEARPGDAL